MRKIYNCNTCNYETGVHCNYKKHLQTKKHIQNINRTDIRSFPKNGSNKYKCKYCNKSISQKNHVQRHYDACKNKIKHDILKEKQELELIKQQLELEKLNMEQEKNKQINEMAEKIKLLEQEKEQIEQQKEEIEQQKDNIKDEYMS